MSPHEFEEIRRLAINDYDAAIGWAWENCPELRDFWETWSAHCGAPKRVFMGHTIAMLAKEKRE